MLHQKCPTCGQVKRRSNPQNARLHLLFGEIAEKVKAKDGLYHPLQWWKCMLVDRYLGYDEYLRPDGKTLYVMKHTSNLNVEELNQFMERCEKFAAERNVWLQD
jgi:NinB protein